jgi:ElaB/YqjD/DUF883 family membrane-anchored ribosome-binding protein
MERTQNQINDLTNSVKEMSAKIDTLMNNHLAHLNKEIVNLTVFLNKEMSNSQSALSELRSDMTWLKKITTLLVAILIGMVGTVLIRVIPWS